MKFWIGSRAALIDINSSGKSIEREVLYYRIGSVIRDEVCEEPSGCGTCFEAAIVPSCVEIEIADRRFTDECRPIH